MILNHKDAISIEEEFDILLHKAAQIDDPFEQSFFVLAPMSFLTMDDAAYIDGLIGLYELGNVGIRAG